MPFNLVLVSQGVCALGLPKGKIQYMADLAQNGAEKGLDGIWDLGNVMEIVRKSETTFAAREESQLPSLHETRGMTFLLKIHRNHKIHCSTG